MPRFQQNDNFIDKTFTILAESVVKILPASRQEKEAFNYYKEGLTAQSSGRYAEALESYYEALKLEEDLIVLFKMVINSLYIICCLLKFY